MPRVAWQGKSEYGFEVRVVITNGKTRPPAVEKKETDLLGGERWTVLRDSNMVLNILHQALCDLVA